MKTRPLRVIATSIDGDNCIFNHGYTHGGKTPNRVIFYNQGLINFLLSRYSADRFALNVILPGSLRQSYATDAKNSKRNHSASFFEELASLHRHLKAKVKGLKLSKYLLADLKSTKPEGYAFEKARGKIIDRGKHPDSIDDESKLALLYLQMHKLAAENPEALIDFHFIDDRYDILDKLEAFYKAYPELLPSNLVLDLHQYAGIKVNSYKSMDGKGPIDYQYEDGFLDMVSNVSSSRLNPGDSVILGHNQIYQLFNLNDFKLKRGLNYSQTKTAADLHTTASIITELGTTLAIDKKNNWSLPPLDPCYFSADKKPWAVVEQEEKETSLKCGPS